MHLNPNTMAKNSSGSPSDKQQQLRRMTERLRELPSPPPSVHIPKEQSHAPPPSAAGRSYRNAVRRSSSCPPSLQVRESASRRRQAIAIENRRNSLNEKIRRYMPKLVWSVCAFMQIETELFKFTLLNGPNWYLPIIGPMIGLFSWLVMAVFFWKFTKATKELISLSDQRVRFYDEPAFQVLVLGLLGLSVVVINFIIASL